MDRFAARVDNVAGARQNPQSRQRRSPRRGGDPMSGAWRFLVAGMIIVLVAGACGSGSKNAGPTTTAAAPSTTTTLAGGSSTTTTISAKATTTTTAAAAPIVVVTPSAGQHVTSPVHVTGSANVFEATFRVQVTDASGHLVADQQVMASAGTGTRGTFDVEVAYTNAVGGAGKLIAFDLSAKDGSRQDVVTIPLDLAAV